MIKNFNKNYIKIEIIYSKPEKIINLLWKNNIPLKNINKKNTNVIITYVLLKDYKTLYYICKENGAKIKVTKRYGRGIYLNKIKNRIGLSFGIIIFFFIIYYLSSYIWSINIIASKYLTPYEIRKELYSLDIIPGIRAKDINVYELENKLLKDNSNISWIKIRKEAGSLRVEVKERQEPPSISNEGGNNIIVSSRDAEILRVYTTSGKPVVKKGDIVKRGQLLLDNKQGKEGEEYEVKAKGIFIGKTFYEGTKVISLINMRKERTGEEKSNFYINILNKRIYIKNNENIFEYYDKIYKDNFIFGRETIYKVENKPYYISPDFAIEKAKGDIRLEIMTGLDNGVKVIEERVYSNILKDRVEVNLIIVVEEDIGINQIPNEEK